MADYGIIISNPGSDTSDVTAAQIALRTNNPFIKIDTQNTAGFQTITLLITTNPPEPIGPATDAYVTLYKFKHGYTYIPSLETLFFLSSPPASASGYQLYSQDLISLGGRSVNDNVNLYAVADATWVYIICNKQNFGGGLANNLTGTNLLITTHVFVEDIGV